MGTFLPILQILVCMHVLWWGVQGMPIKSHDDTLICFLSGAGSYEGVVCYQAEGRHALICDQTWTNKEAAVACRMQGYEGGTATKVVDLGPEVSTDILQWDIVCNGNEERLEDCTVTKRDNPTSCTPENIAQVRCGANKEQDWNLRTTKSENSEQGQLEIYKNGEWSKASVDPRIGGNGRPYSTMWDYEKFWYERWLLHHYNREIPMPSQGSLLDTGVRCQLNPSDNKMHCRHHTDGTGHGAFSKGSIVCTVYDVIIPARLVAGRRKSEGRVEVYYEGQWGSVCDNLWTIREARVLCKQLGYTGADEVVIAGHFGQGEGDVLLDMVQCTGDEANLFECAHSGIRTTACDHSEDVGVVCTSEDECLSTPCRNGGTCRHLADNGYRCDCIDPFIGQNCEIENECLVTPCLNGGTCQLTEIGYRCDCMDPFIRQNCDIVPTTTSSPSSTSARGSSISIVVGSAVGANLVIFVVIVLIIIFYKRRSNESATPQYENPVFDQSQTDAIMHDPTEEFSLMGAGGEMQ